MAGKPRRARDDHDHLLAYLPSADICMAVAMGLVQPGMVVIDVGCGNGEDARYLAERGCWVTGLDRAAGAINYARRIARAGSCDPMPTFHRTDDITSWLEDRPGAVDVVSDRLFLSNIRNARMAARYIRAVATALREDGLFIVRYGFNDGVISGKARTPRYIFSEKSEEVISGVFSRAFRPLAWSRAGKAAARKTAFAVTPMLPARGEYVTKAMCLIIEKKNGE